MIPDLPNRPRILEFSKREFTIDEFRHLGSLKSVVSLTFSDCPIGDKHVAELCRLPRLIFLSLEGTLISDAVFEDLARLPKLDFLVLDRTRITGNGLGRFSQHTSLRTLWLCETKINDSTIPCVAQIPKLSIPRIAKTSVSFEGLMSLAVNPRIEVVADGQFTKHQMADFEAAQRTFARSSRNTRQQMPLSTEDRDNATLALQRFFDAMAKWERDQLQESRNQSVSATAVEERDRNAQSTCAAIFEEYCTPKPRTYGRPNAISYSDPPEYSQEMIIDIEVSDKNKAIIYTKDALETQRRYLLVKSRGKWRVDHRECLMDGWSRDFL